MAEAKTFPLGEVLSVTTGRLLSEIGGVYRVMGHVLEDPGITTIGLAMMRETVKAAILEQHPQLAEADVSAVTRETWRADLAELEARFGATLELRPMQDSPGAPSLDAQVAHVLSVNPSIKVIALTLPEEDRDG